MADYPAGVVHSSYDNSDPSVNPIGTGPYLPETNEVGVKQVLAKNANHTWWGTAVYGGPWLDKIEYVDLGTDTWDGKSSVTLADPIAQSVWSQVKGKGEADVAFNVARATVKYRF